MPQNIWLNRLRLIREPLPPENQPLNLRICKVPAENLHEAPPVSDGEVYVAKDLPGQHYFYRESKKVGQADEVFRHPAPEGIFVPQQGQELLRRKFRQTPERNRQGNLPLESRLWQSQNPCPS